jgi:chorismate mutase
LYFIRLQLSIFAFKNCMTELEIYREKIDAVDRKLIDLLAERFGYSVRIGEIKIKGNMPVLQSGRWDSIMVSRKEYAVKAGLSEKFTCDFLTLVHDESIRIQDQISGDGQR